MGGQDVGGSRNDGEVQSSPAAFLDTKRIN